MFKLYNLQFLLTRNCNRTCYYCNNFKDSTEVSIDMDYIKWVLTSTIYKDMSLHIELSGGEPGLVTNIVELINTINSLDNVKKISILSNGLMRKKYGYMQNLIGPKLYESIEHLALDIDETNIQWFDPNITFYNQYTGEYRDNEYGVIVLTNKTVDSLIKNFNFFDRTDLFVNKIFFKKLTPKTISLDKEIEKKYNIFYNLLNNTENINYLTANLAESEKINRSEYEIQKYNLCAKYSNLQFIDLESKEIGMCSMQVEQSTRFKIKDESMFISAVDGKLFEYNDFCKNECKKQCIRIDDIINNRNKKIPSDYWNMNFSIRNKKLKFDIKNNSQLSESNINSLKNIIINTYSEIYKLEYNISNKIGINRCITVSNGTSGIMLGLIALRLRKGDSIVIPSYSYPAAYRTSNFLELNIILCDIKYDTLCLDPDKLRIILTLIGLIES